MAGIDTHSHSTASDGALTPSQLVLRAQQAGLLGLALTDHDTVSGLAEFLAAGRKADFPVIPGIELSAEWQEHDVHILGYWFDVEQMESQPRLRRLSDTRVERVRLIAGRLERLGMTVDAEAIIASAGKSPGRPHIARAMVESGYAATVKEAFAKWLSRDMPAYVPRDKLSPFEAVELIQSVGGVAAVAHPGCGVPDNVLAQLIRVGVAGIEVYHPDHNAAAEQKYARIATLNGLAALGGSDFHVPGMRELGCRVTTVGQLGKLASLRRDESHPTSI